MGFRPRRISGDSGADCLLWLVFFFWDRRKETIWFKRDSSPGGNRFCSFFPSPSRGFLGTVPFLEGKKQCQVVWLVVDFQSNSFLGLLPHLFKQTAPVAQSNCRKAEIPFLFLVCTGQRRTKNETDRVTSFDMKINHVFFPPRFPGCKRFEEVPIVFHFFVVLAGQGL